MIKIRQRRRHFKRHSSKQDKVQKRERVLVEDEDHPELTRAIQWRERRDRRLMRFTKHDHRRRRLADKLNKQHFTYWILGFTIILGMVYLFFGFASVLTLAGYTNKILWGFYSSTSFFGWKGHAITGVALIITGIIILWSVPFYFRNKIQQGDSYLIIGSGIGVLFGFIYILIILADILKGIVIGLSDATPIIIETYFYPSFLLAMFAIPLFRTIALRHFVAPTEEEDEEYEEDLD